MRINEIRKKEADITLDSDELVILSNMLYYYEQHYEEHGDNKPRPKFHELAAQIITARDLCQYGHLDSFALSCVLKHKIAANPEKDWLKHYLNVSDVSNEQSADVAQAGKGD